jgi:hypothetical protein
MEARSEPFFAFPAKAAKAFVELVVGAKIWVYASISTWPGGEICTSIGMCHLGFFGPG